MNSFTSKRKITLFKCRKIDEQFNPKNQSTNPQSLFKSISFLATLFSFFIFFCSCTSPNGMMPQTDTHIPVTNILFSQASYIITNGEGGQFTATVQPTNHTDGDLQWQSSDTNVFIIDENGNYQAPRRGTATVTATLGDISNTLSVTVKALGTNVIFSNHIATVTSHFYGQSNVYFSNRFTAVIHYTTNGFTNLFLSNGFQSNLLNPSFSLSNPIIVVTTNVFTNTNVVAIDEDSYHKITNVTYNIYETNDTTNRYEEVVLYPQLVTNTNWTNWDFSGANLSSLILTNYNLSNANLSNANLSNADLRYATITDINLMGAENTELANWGLDFSSTGTFIRGIWSSETTIWVLNDSALSHANVAYAYNLLSKSRNTSQEFNTLDSAENNTPSGLWSDNTNMWIIDASDDKIYAYDLQNKNRLSSQDFDTLSNAGNNDPVGLWSDGTILWVSDISDDKIYAYDLQNKNRLSNQDFNTLSNAGNNDPNSLWSDGTTLWVVDGEDNKLYAYSLSTKNRIPDQDFDLPLASYPVGLWSDGTTLWVGNQNGHSDIYAYNLRSKVRTP